MLQAWCNSIGNQLVSPRTRSNRLQLFFKIGVLINFAEFSGKYLCQNLLFSEVAGLRSESKKSLIKQFSWFIFSRPTNSHALRSVITHARISSEMSHNFTFSLIYGSANLYYISITLLWIYIIIHAILFNRTHGLMSVPNDTPGILFIERGVHFKVPNCSIFRACNLAPSNSKYVPSTLTMLGSTIFI